MRCMYMCVEHVKQTLSQDITEEGARIKFSYILLRECVARPTTIR